jgi:hypothetical protein
MIHLQTKRTFPVLCAVVAALSLTKTPAWAADAPGPAAETTKAPALPPPPEPKPPAPEPKAVPANTEDTGTAAQGGQPLLGFVERLPPESYPNDPIRGLYGGSLWMTFHGMQWPYYRRSGIGVSGYAWIDTGYEGVTVHEPNVSGIKYLLQQGRVLLRVTPTWTNGEYFVQAQAELVALRDQLDPQPIQAQADDVWIKVGRWAPNGGNPGIGFDLQAGRFEAWEVYHYGMGFDLFTQERIGARSFGVYNIGPSGTSPGPIYGLDYTMYRTSGVGQAAAHLYANKNLRFEVSSELGSQTKENVLSVRPVGVYDIGFLKVKAGLEYASQTSQVGLKDSLKERGVAAAAQFVFDPYVEFGINGAYGLTDVHAADGSFSAAASDTIYSFGAFLNWSPFVQELLVGFGYDYTYLEDQHFQPALGRNGKFREQQGFVALQYVLWKQLFIKAVGAYAKADIAPTFAVPLFSNYMASGRLRLEFLF